MKTQECEATESKECTKCKETKPLSEYHTYTRVKKGPRAYRTLCKDCIKARDRAKYLKNPTIKKCSRKKYADANRETINANAAEYREDNREQINLTAKVYRESNREVLADRSKEWYAKADKVKIAGRMSAYRQNNLEKYREYGLRRSHILKTARVDWGEKDLIDDLYREARRLTKAHGIQYHVDHIVPLTNDGVSGLHCLANLQILTAEENHRKYNSFYG